jgi:hypothetical protein
MIFVLFIEINYKILNNRLFIKFYIGEYDWKSLLEQFFFFFFSFFFFFFLFFYLFYHICIIEKRDDIVGEFLCYAKVKFGIGGYDKSFGGE